MRIRIFRNLFGPVSLACLLAAGSVAAQSVSPQDRETLVEFYHATGGENWHESGGWLDPEVEVCDWHGIVCDGSGLERLVLPDNNLTGSVNLAALDRLNLERLNLRDNHIGGSLNHIPVRTRYLDLSNNRFEGSLNIGLIEDAPELVIQDPLHTWDLSGNELTGALPAHWNALELAHLDLSGNRFSERLPDAWGEMASLVSLDLSGNHFSGSIPDAWHGMDALRRLDLSGTGLIGPMPEVLVEMDSLEVLRLADNELIGELPAWFTDLDLRHLDLDNNALSGPVSFPFEALDPDRGALILHLANNEFTGAIPDDFGFERFDMPHKLSDSPEFGLDLCWNPITLPDEAVMEKINDHHRGFDLSGCTGRQRSLIDSGISGSWYNPQRSGEGTTQLLLPDGTLLVFWFSYAPAYSAFEGQAWFMGMTRPGDNWAEFRPLVDTTGGQFAQGLHPENGEVRETDTWMRIDRLDADHQHFFYERTGLGICFTGMCSYDSLTERFDHTRLTRLAGTSCNNQHPDQWISGLWHNPDRDADGFVVEVNEDGRGIVYWFTHTADGSGQQAWMSGDGQFIGDTLHVDNLIRPTGSVFGPDFDPDDLDRSHWGELTIEFHDDDSGHVYYDSVHEEFGSGDYPLQRLAKPKLADCGE